MATTTSELEQRPACLPEELRANTLFLIARLGYTVKARVLEKLEQAGFSMYEYSVLATLAEGACEAQATIADLLRLDRSQLVGVLDRLEDRGLVERRRDPDDRRRHKVSLTAKGKREFAKLRAIVRKLDAAVLEPLDEDARKSFHDALLTVAAHNDSRFGPPPSKP